MRLAVISCALAISSFGADTWPGKDWETASPSDAGLDATKLAQARDYALTAEGAGYIIHKGKLVMSWGDTA